MRIWEGLVEVFSPFCLLDDARAKEDKISGFIFVILATA